MHYNKHIHNYYVYTTLYISRQATRSGKEIFVTYYAKNRCNVKCTHTCRQSFWREVTNCRIYEVNPNCIIRLKWTLKLLVCWQFRLAQDNGDCQAVLVAIMIIPVPKKPCGFHLSIFSKTISFQQILFRGKKTFVLRKIFGLYSCVTGEACRQNPPLMQWRYHRLFWENT